MKDDTLTFWKVIFKHVMSVLPGYNCSKFESFLMRLIKAISTTLFSSHKNLETDASLLSTDHLENGAGFNFVNTVYSNESIGKYFP